MIEREDDISLAEEPDDRDAYNFKYRDVYCPRCNINGVSNRRMPKCKVCKGNLITVAHTSGERP